MGKEGSCVLVEQSLLCLRCSEGDGEVRFCHRYLFVGAFLLLLTLVNRRAARGRVFEVVLK